VAASEFEYDRSNLVFAAVFHQFDGLSQVSVIMIYGSADFVWRLFEFTAPAECGMAVVNGHAANGTHRRFNIIEAVAAFEAYRFFRFGFAQFAINGKNQIHEIFKKSHHLKLPVLSSNLPFSPESNPERHKQKSEIEGHVVFFYINKIVSEFVPRIRVVSAINLGYSGQARPHKMSVVVVWHFHYILLVNEFDPLRPWTHKTHFTQQDVD